MTNSSEIGKIKSLALLDFLTYDELKYFPGDNLNIIIGPNGTGKSTIVAGIILGCGGKPILLSRSKDISDYVKNGKTKAHIEIELASDERGGVITFHRAFDKDSKESFSIDGKSVSYKEYLKRIKTYNIQIDNLCIFLPQDRVQDFTKLNPQELLHNTQISVCDATTNDAFQKLLKIREAQKDNTKISSDTKTRLDDNMNRNEQLRVMIENNKLKDKLLAEVDILIKKKTWKETEELSVKFKDVEKDMKTMTATLQKKYDDLKPLQRKQESIAGTKNDLKNAISKFNTGMASNMTEFQQLEDATQSIESEVNRARQDLKNAISSKDDNEKQVNELRLLIQIEENDQKQASAALVEEGIEAKMKQCDMDAGKIIAANKKLMQKRGEINQIIDDKITPSLRRCEMKIQNLTNSQSQRLEVLKNNFEDPYRAYQWLQENRNGFKGKIFNPILTEITVKDQNNAKYVENTISMKDLQVFICTNKEDMARLIKKLRNELRLNVNIAFSEDTDRVSYHPSCDIRDYPQHLGLYSYLIDMIEGPAPVINYLCRIYQIHRVAVGDDNTFKNASQVPNDLRVFFSTNHRFHVSVSRYSNAKSTSSAQIQDRSILNVAVDNRLKQHEERNMQKWTNELSTKQDERKKIEEQLKAGEDTITEIRNIKQGYQQRISMVNNSIKKLLKKKAELENLMNRKIDVKVERKKFKDNVDSLVKRLLGVAMKRLARLEEYKNQIMQVDLARKKLQVFNESTGNLDDQIQEVQKAIDISKDLHDRLKVEYESTKNRFKNKQRDALKLTDGVPPSDPGFKYHEQFKKVPESIGELQNAIEEMEGRIECLPGVDTRILTEYEDRSREIEILHHQLAQEQKQLYDLEKNMNIFHATWFPSISETIATINEKFSSFFNKMGFVGEVELIRKDERDYADYGIQIRVQYRDNERLQALNRHVQSGGERAVAIAVYTLSLQHLTSVPFRCVDEINQGMDPKNERKIFQMLVDITCKPDQSQYFFVTPKLLPDLPHSDLMTISVVHNGKHIDDPYVFLDCDEDDDEGMEED